MQESSEKLSDKVWQKLTVTQIWLKSPSLKLQIQKSLTTLLNFDKKYFKILQFSKLEKICQGQFVKIHYNLSSLSKFIQIRQVPPNLSKFEKFCQVCHNLLERQSLSTASKFIYFIKIIVTDSQMTNSTKFWRICLLS